METIKFKDVAHLYVGCKLKINTGEWGTFFAYYTTNDRPVMCDDTIRGDYEFDEVKPILRPMLDITEEEAKQAYLKEFKITPERANCNLNDAKEYFSHVDRSRPETFTYLLSRGFDLFGLIESGEALDATKLT